MAMYKITIDARGQSKKEKQESKLNQVNSSNKKTSSNDKESTLKALKNAAGTQAAIMIGKTATNIAINYTSTVGVRTDNMARQNEINNTLTAINTFESMGSNAISAAAAGAMVGGPAGAVLAAAQIVVDLANKAYQAYQNIKEYNREFTQDSLNASHASERLGITCTDKNR